jgi:hypothetical protein
MNKVSRFLLLALLIPLFAMGADAAKADYKTQRDYKIHDDCLGNWAYCELFWMGNLDRFGRRAFKTIPYGNRDHIDCEEGRLLVLSSGFDRVRSLECEGAAYTYLARRNGSSYRIWLNSRSGRFLAIDPI